MLWKLTGSSFVRKDSQAGLPPEESTSGDASAVSTGPEESDTSGSVSISVPVGSSILYSLSPYLPVRP